MDWTDKVKIGSGHVTQKFVWSINHPHGKDMEIAVGILQTLIYACNGYKYLSLGYALSYQCGWKPASINWRHYWWRQRPQKTKGVRLTWWLFSLYSEEPYVGMHAAVGMTPRKGEGGLCPEDPKRVPGLDTRHKKNEAEKQADWFSTGWDCFIGTLRSLSPSAGWRLSTLRGAVGQVCIHTWAASRQYS